MNFRPLVGYLILEGAALLLFAAELWGVYQLGLGIQVFWAGIVFGTAVGIFVAVRAWNYILAIISQQNTMTPKDSKKLFGPRPLHWFFVLLNLHAFFHPLQGNKILLSAYVLAGGMLNGGVSAYFLFLIVKVFLREYGLRQNIIIRVG